MPHSPAKVHRMFELVEPIATITFSAGPAQFFALDTNEVSEAQLMWLDAELKKSSAKWKLVYGHHPIYSDEAYAKTTRYGGLIAPPSIHILLMFSCTPADDWMRSPGTVNAGQSWSYHIPARPGDVITLQARALDKFIKRERLFVVHDNVFFNQHGQVICSGRGWTIRPQ